eukprot:scaffold114299_cov43-Phaeocystis_antarctica.AAC.2
MGGTIGGRCHLGGAEPQASCPGTIGVWVPSPTSPASPASPPVTCGAAATGTRDSGSSCGDGGGGGGGGDGGSGGSGGGVAAARKLRASHRLQAAAFAALGRGVARRPLAVAAGCVALCCAAGLGLLRLQEVVKGTRPHLRPQPPHPHSP